MIVLTVDLSSWRTPSMSHKWVERDPITACNGEMLRVTGYQCFLREEPLLLFAAFSSIHQLSIVNGLV